MNNAFGKPCAKPSSLEFCHGEKGYHEMEPTRFARVLQSCCKGNNMIQRFR